MSNRKDEKGFSILEGMVALAILTAGMLGVGTMLTTSLTIDRRSTAEKNAQLIMLDKVEYLRKLPRSANPLAADREAIDHVELVPLGVNTQTFNDYGGGKIYSGGTEVTPPAHPEEVETVLDTDFSKRNLFARRWTVSRLFWSDPVYMGSLVDSGLLQVDIMVGWPVRGNCTKEDPSQCDRKIEMTTYFRPLAP